MSDLTNKSKSCIMSYPLGGHSSEAGQKILGKGRFRDRSFRQSLRAFTVADLMNFATQIRYRLRNDNGRCHE